MDLKRLQTLDLLQPTNGLGVKNKGSQPASGHEFAQTLDQIENKNLDTSIQKSTAEGLDLKNGLEKIKFSNHAVERMKTRGIYFNAEDLNRIGSAVDKAAAKGSKQSLILMNDSALIVSVKNNTVVTVMDKAHLKENVFTNIDSTIVM